MTDRPLSVPRRSEVPPRSIFFDLETSDLEPIGQILNFSFIVVDRSWTIVDELSGRIRLSRLQLPRAGAIVANRIDVQEHQRLATLNELEAMGQIDEFVRRIISAHPKWSVPLIGYNSSRFDLLHIRTSLIRNGMNPYWPLLYRDLLQVVQKLALTSAEFEAMRSSMASELGLEPTQRLEFISRCLGTLKGAQLHESRADVILTIETAQRIQERFAVDVRSFESYEVRAIHRAARGTVIEGARLGPRAEWRPYTFHTGTDRSALWLDLRHYTEQGRSAEAARGALRWASCTTQGFLFKQQLEGEWNGIAREALAHVKQVTLDNYFPESTCDIEQFIYRISPGDIPSLAEHFPKRKSPERWNPDMRTLHLRHRLANYQMGAGSDTAVQRALADYARYRYGGRLQLAKTIREPDEEDSTQHQFHMTLREMMMELEELSASTSDSEVRALLNSLKHFYLESEIYQLVGAELLAAGEQPACQNSV